jgi:hypothetical protein
MTSDTDLDAQARFDAILHRRSGSDRVVMACEMFDLARALMAARVRELEPNITAVELKIRVFQRMYGDDIDADMMARAVHRRRRCSE